MRARSALAKLAFYCAALGVLSSCISMPKDEYRVTESRQIEERVEFGEIVLSRIAEDVWMHTSYLDVFGTSPIASNGLLVLREDDAVLVDTAWTDQQTDDILRYAAAVLDRPVRQAIVTHFHQDKMGGIGALHRADVQTWAHPLTNELAPSVDFEPARNTFAFSDEGWALRGAETFPGIAIYFPGGGHTRDNIAVGLPGRGIAFAGCLIKGEDFRTLGNLEDADLANYATAARRFGAAFPQVQTIVMSHSAPSDRGAIRHTARMADEFAAD